MPDEPTPEPQNVAEASAQLAALGDPGFATADTDDVIEPEAPGAEGGAPAPPAGDATPAPEPTTPAPADDPYAEWGGRQVVEDAVVIARGLKTEAGVRTLVAQGLQAIGYTPAQIQAALAGGATSAPTAAAPAAPADPLDGIEDDDVVSGGDVKKLVARAIESATAEITAQVKAQVDPVREQAIADRQARTNNVIDGTIVELLGTGGDESTVDRDTAGEVLVAAEKYVEEDNWDAAHIRAALVKGHADVVARQERVYEQYLAKKKAVKDASPVAAAGAGGAGEPPPREPQNLAEARQMAKEAGLFK